MRSYLANSLFSLADQAFNKHLVYCLRSCFPELELYAPQENEAINDKTAYANSVMISRGDDEYLLDSDFMIAVIDGVEIDSGVACEIGKFAGFDINYQLRTGKNPRPIFALFTDCRQQGRDNMKKLHALSQDAVENQFPYRNLYVIGTIKDSGGCISSSIEQLVDNIGKYVETRS
jgi:nucleoside 2-deoxyribosyltransferase